MLKIINSIMTGINEIPAAAPKVTKSLLDLSLRRSWNFVHEVSNPNVSVLPWDTAAPIIEPA